MFISKFHIMNLLCASLENDNSGFINGKAQI